MNHFTDRGITIAYRDVGSGPAMLFLHNGGTSSSIWRHQLEALSSRWRCVAVDLPGFGASPRPAVPPSLNDLVALSAALIDELNLAPVVVVGNCMGANIAVSLANSRPDLVDRVLAINPLTEASFSAGGLGVLHRMGRVAAGPTAVLRSLARRIPVTRLAAVQTLRFQLGSRGRAARLHHDRELLASQQRPDQLPALIDVLDDMEAYGRLDRASGEGAVPTRIVWGAENHVLSRRKATHLSAALAADRVEVVGGCGHLPMLEDPETVTSIIEEFAS